MKSSDPDGQKQAEGVDADVALTSGDLLAHVDALTGGRNAGGGLDVLRVQHARTRLVRCPGPKAL